MESTFSYPYSLAHSDIEDVCEGESLKVEGEILADVKMECHEENLLTQFAKEGEKRSRGC